jgi:hypothetical protein
MANLANKAHTALGPQEIFKISYPQRFTRNRLRSGKYVIIIRVIIRSARKGNVAR